MAETFAQQREDLLETLADLATRLEQAGAADEAATARTLAKKLTEQTFNVVVVGAFKRGKSTLVNALLGEELLPTAAVPLTTVVTCVTFGDHPRAEAVYADGTVEEIPSSAIARYVTEAENPANTLGVDRILVTSRSPDLADGVFLVDTPGTESVHRHNTERALEILPEIDAAIFVTSADPPISETERAFLDEVARSAARVFVVVNKMDHVSADQREETLEFTRRVVAEVVGKDDGIFAVSALDALRAKLAGDEEALARSGLPAFERSFRELLLRDKGAVLLETARRRASELIDQRIDALRTEERLLELSRDELASTTARLEAIFARAERARDDLVTLLGRDTQRVVKRVEDDLGELWRDASESLTGLVARLIGEADRIDPDAIEQRMRDALRSDIDAWREREDAAIAAAFREATDRFRDQVHALLVETMQLAGDALDVRFTSRPEPIELSEDSSFTYHFFEGVPTLVESLLPDLRRYLPRRTVARVLERDLRTRIPLIVDKHCGRLRYDFVQRLERSRATLQRQLDERLGAAIGSIRTAIERSASELAHGSGAVTERIGEIERERSDLSELALRIQP